MKNQQTFRNSPVEVGLDKRAANFSPLSPLTFLPRSASVYPEHTSIIHHSRRYTWAETYTRCRRLASALNKRGLVHGDTVSILAANIPAMYEAHFGVPLAGMVLNTINIRLDASSIAFILKHAEAKAFLVDRELSGVAAQALDQARVKPLVIDIDDDLAEGGEFIGATEYETFLKEGDPNFEWSGPADEWQAITLNYTSGTTGNPKGVVYHHRGAYLNALGNNLVWDMGHHPVYLWTLPMFHCNGWCFPWTLAALAGTSVCLRKVTTKGIYDALADQGVTHLCGAPIIMNTIVNAKPEERREFSQRVDMMTAGAAPPAATLSAIEAIGFCVTHVYGLTETYGPGSVCSWKKEWNTLLPAEQAKLKARQGVRYHVLQELEVLNPQTMRPVPRDGRTMGEVMLKGNTVMKGYLKNPEANEEALHGGWFHSGDLAVLHPDGYIELKDRSKDIIISGGENISSIEVEDVLYKHPAVLEAAVVARPDEKWGETPCAFVKLKKGVRDVTETDIILFCRENMARFKVPKTVIFGDLPKTATGKIQKYQLRKTARELEKPEAAT